MWTNLANVCKVGVYTTISGGAFSVNSLRYSRVFLPALPCYLHIQCTEVNEHRYACISIKDNDEQKTGHGTVVAVFRTCCSHNASDRSLSMWRRKRRPRNAIISLYISSRSIYNFRSLCFDDITHFSVICYCGVRKFFWRYLLTFDHVIHT